METPEKLPGPDLARDGAALKDFANDMLEGHFEGVPVLLVRKGEGGLVRAISAKCTH